MKVPGGILSPIDKQAVAEAELLKFFRENGVFDPPKDGERFYGHEAQQVLHMDMLIHAAVKFCREKYGGDPRPVLRILSEEITDLIRRYL